MQIHMKKTDFLEKWTCSCRSNSGTTRSVLRMALLKARALSLAVVIIALVSSVESIKVLRNTLDISAPPPLVGGASLVNASSDVSTEDLTICLRFKLKILGWFEKNSRLLTIANWRDSEEDDGDVFNMLWLGAWYPFSFFGFGNPKRSGSYASFLLKYPNTTEFKVWIPNKWTHLCLSYERKTSFLRVVKVHPSK